MLPGDWLDQIRKAYPKRVGGQGWGLVRTKVLRLVAQGESFDEILAGAQAYGDLMRATGDAGTCYVKQAATFFGPGEWWREEYDLPTDGTVELTIDQQAEQHGIQRAAGEDDASLTARLGVAMTKQRYGVR